MAEFVIKMADEHGHVLEQTENGISPNEVRERFSQLGYMVYWVKPRGLLVGGQIQLPRRRKIRMDTFVVFNQQFVTLIRAGLPILTALDLLIRRQRNLYFRTLLQNVRDRVKSGELLSDAFAAQGAFQRIYTTTLLAGEKSGNLEEVLNRYISFQRLAMTFRKKLIASLIYPALLATLVVVMLAFLLTYVIPQFATLYTAIGRADAIPPLTQFMLAIGVGAQHYAIHAAAFLLLVFALVWRWSHSQAGGFALERLRARIPLFGEISLKYQVAMFARMLATLLAGGLPLVPSLETAGSSMQSRLMASALARAANRVREGASLSKSLEETGSVPDLAVEMIEVGESTGALPAMLTSVAEFYEEDVQTALTAAMSLIEPAILIVMGVIVAFVLLSLYLPIFTLGAGGVR
ncbi:MAG: type II secretion system F family protein [Acidobacteriia bacterium]|nr:type II secretion system F family protein [Terriglobia bacterium]